MNIQVSCLSFFLDNSQFGIYITVINKLLLSMKNVIKVTLLSKIKNIKILKQAKNTISSNVYQSKDISIFLYFGICVINTKHIKPQKEKLKYFLFLSFA